MSSYTDATLQFSPYISQMPRIQERSIVGREKQAKYEEGVQRIQSQIDNVAGLDVVRDVDKQYLQSKLDELGNNLKTVAAGDFSNFQLVNSVGGMVNKIAKDEDVVNAVQSTNWYKKQLGEIETARKEGKSSVQNEWDFSTKANEWLYSNNVKDRFSGTYTPYVDVDKKFFEVLKNLHSDLREQDISYETNPDGTINYQKTAAVMQRKSKEFVSAERLEGALRASLSPDEINQLGINGRFQFKDIDGAGMGNYFKTMFGATLKKNNTQIEEFKELAKPLANGKEKDAILSSISSLEDENKKLISEMNSEISFALSSPELAKEYIYKNEAIKQFAQTYSWEHSKLNELQNHRLEAEHWEKNDALNRAKFQLDVDKFDWSKVKDRFDMEMSSAEFNAKYGLQGELFDSYGGVDTKIKPSTVTAENQRLKLETEASKQAEELAKQMGVNVGMVEGYLEKLANGEKDVPVDQRYKEVFDEILEKRADARAIEKGLKEARTKVESSEKYVAKTKELNEALDKLSDINVEGVHFSRGELLNYVAKIPERTVGYGHGYGARANYFEVANPTEKEKILQAALESNKTLQTEINKYSSVYKGKYRDLHSELQEDIEVEFGSSNATYLPRHVALPIEESKDLNRWMNIASSALESYKGGKVSGMKGGTELLTKEHVEKAERWLGEDNRNKVIYGKVEQGRKTFLQMKLGNEEILIPLTQEQSGKLPLIDRNSSSEEDIRLTERLSLGRGSTNPDGNFSDSYYPSSKFSRVSRLNVRGDVSQNYKNNGIKYLTLRLVVNGKVVPLDIERPTNRAQIESSITQFTDDIIKGLYLESPKISNEIKEAIKKL